MAVAAGTRVGRFVLHEYVGQSPVGTLYRARDDAPGGLAVTLLDHLATDEGRTWFRRAAPGLAALRHPNLVTVVAHGEHEGVPYVAAVDPGGTTLDERFRRSAVSPAEALRVLAAVGAGIDHAHTAGVRHGCLGPGRVVLPADGEPLVADFGLTHVKGSRAAARAADLRAFAAIAHQLLADRAPQAGEDTCALPMPAGGSRPLPPEVDAVLSRAMASEPRARWTTCAAMVDALTGALGALAAAPAPEPEPDAVPSARRIWPYLAGAALVVAGLGTLAGFLGAGR